MKNTLETRLGIFVALAVIAAVLILEIVGGVERFQRGYELRTEFSNVQDLKEGDRVKMAGVEVGRVEKIGIDQTNSKVLVVMKMRKGVPVRTDSVAMVKFTGLMGQNYVSLDFGKRGELAEPGAMIPSAEQPDFSAMMGKLDAVATGVEKLTSSFTGDKIDNVLGPLTAFIKDARVPLTMTISNLQTVTGEIAAGRGTVGRLINDDSLYNAAFATITNLQDTAADIKVAVAEARKAVDQVNSGNGTVGKLLHDEALYKETTAAAANLREILEKINQGQGSVGKMVNNNELYNNAKLTLQKLDQATEGLEDQGPLSVLGSAVSKLF
jgi:phospholipid/cholesterol/gamma-HCH transport system substrate-binding protein